MIEWATPGRKIVCITDISNLSYWDEIFPEVGKVYTIRAVERRGEECAFYLEEIKNNPHLYRDGLNECCFDHAIFRPLVETRSDISIFTRMFKHREDALV